MKSLLWILINPPDKPPLFSIAVTYVGRGKYESTFPFDRSIVAMLNLRFIPFNAQSESVENWLIGIFKAVDPIV